MGNSYLLSLLMFQRNHLIWDNYLSARYFTHSLAYPIVKIVYNRSNTSKSSKYYSFQSFDYFVDDNNKPNPPPMLHSLSPYRLFCLSHFNNFYSYSYLDHIWTSYLNSSLGFIQLDYYSHLELDKVCVK